MLSQRARPPALVTRPAHNHAKHSPTATTPSPTPRSEAKKKKSELCRRFMDSGFCPYEGRCKFAHGCHELLRNQQANVKYKTKECENFQKKLYCMYGNRCNFIHRPLPQQTPPDRTDIPLQLAKRHAEGSSRLLRALGC